MDLEELKTYLLSGSGIIALLLTLIQISPININPWSYIARTIGKALNKELFEEVEKINEEVLKLKNKSDERAANGYRSQILRFGDEVIHGVPHSKEHYDNILMIIHKYQVYCTTHPNYMNNVAVNTIAHIERMYQEHLRDDSFL